jgi:hypothetical protein
MVSASMRTVGAGDCTHTRGVVPHFINLRMALLVLAIGALRRVCR